MHVISFGALMHQQLLVGSSCCKLACLRWHCNTDPHGKGHAWDAPDKASFSHASHVYVGCTMACESLCPSFEQACQTCVRVCVPGEGMAGVQCCLALLACLLRQVSHEGIQSSPKALPQLLLQGSCGQGEHAHLALPLHALHLTAPLPEQCKAATLMQHN